METRETQVTRTAQDPLGKDNGNGGSSHGTVMGHPEDVGSGSSVKEVLLLPYLPLALWPSGKTLAQRSGGAGSIPGRVRQRTLKLVLAADPSSVWHYGFSAKSGPPGVRIM
ncbi:hypothetical protein ElyMa_006128000 [Elysia marginata]|uniref:Uncharacterized protein n=1 Tax=Elysia marginata TaxID=1093978 RepID=A0AAV4GY58_9GAST|nr:hypothetical protein ElyMa_006128000 [Elysia marginata]